MVLFVDETENEDLFLVGGVLAASRDDAFTAYKRFKKGIKDYPITENERRKIYTEFKSFILDKGYQRIKARMMREIDSLNGCVIFSCYAKKDSYFPQYKKEEVYVDLLSCIVSSINEDISVIFDGFSIPTFEQTIIETISSHKNVQAIMCRNSQTEPGLQFADNICSVLRHYKTTKEKSECYKIIEKRIREV